ncbi:hypothetical protein [Jeotgalibacillus haloalkalitolerans]|uniref:Uncharacterized protein n=1 Tax=Jeotgalibacillus haloalkalitolerans TaxID=3104292 RepID=A0ABU5KK51_9BACL|nr:hypothetical protein [Jeotgalibacillus sp. HH7-29]MDZ5711635.1 hypothetical protein [Jeotgalibacillus sp. HH7-29]
MKRHKNSRYQELKADYDSLKHFHKIATEQNAEMKEELKVLRSTKSTNVKYAVEQQGRAHYFQVQSEKYEEALRDIDTHIRSTPYPVPYIIGSLKEVLPEYKEATK